MKNYIKNKALVLAGLFMLGITMQPVLGMKTSQKELHDKLTKAIQNDDLDCVKKLLLDGANVNNQDNFMETTPLHLSSSRAMTEYLIKQGANVNLRNYMGLTPLHFCSVSGDIFKTRCLINNNADINSHNNDCSPPVYLATYYNHFKLVKYLVEQGANTTFTPTPYSVAIEKNYINIINYFDQVYNYKTYETIIETTPENQLNVPDYLSINLIQQNIFDTKRVFKALIAFNNKIGCSPNLLPYLKTAQRLNKKWALHELAWLCQETKEYKAKPKLAIQYQTLIQKNALDKLHDQDFTDVFLVSNDKKQF